jgi:hypothetical protein
VVSAWLSGSDKLNKYSCGGANQSASQKSEPQGWTPRYATLSLQVEPVRWDLFNRRLDRNRSLGVANTMASSVDDAIHEFCTLQKLWLETELHAGENEESGPLRNEDVSNKSKQQPHGGGKNQPAGADASSAGERRTGIISSTILTKLESRQISVGLYGRTVVQLGRLGDELLLPVHKFTTGDEVEIRNSSSSTSTSQRSSSGDNNKNTIGGVVCEVTETSLSIALFSSQKGSSAEPEAFFDGPPFTIIPRSNVQVHNKMMKALADLQKMGPHHPVAGKVVEALFRKMEITNNEVDGNIIAKAAEATTIQPFNPRLDASQLEAISFALSSKRPVALIHGPVRFLVVVVVVVAVAGMLKK